MIANTGRAGFGYSDHRVCLTADIVFIVLEVEDTWGDKQGHEIRCHNWLGHMAVAGGQQGSCSSLPSNEAPPVLTPRVLPQKTMKYSGSQAVD